MILWLSREQAEQIGAHAFAERDREVCGLIGGQDIGGGVLRAVEVVPIPNAAVDSTHHFYMDDRALVSAMLGFEARGLSLVGIYHSHPKGESIPSHEDVRDARYPGVAYVIAGWKNVSDTAASLQAWDIQRGSVIPAKLHISADLPTLEDGLSSAGKTAIVLTTLMAVAFMILLSLALLPPAPTLVR